LESPVTIADAHNDLLMEVAFGDAAERDSARRWIGQLRDGNVRLQVCAVGARTHGLPELALREAVAQAAASRSATTAAW
jgi:membrane dipeptidase